MPFSSFFSLNYFFHQFARVWLLTSWCVWRPSVTQELEFKRTYLFESGLLTEE